MLKMFCGLTKAVVGTALLPIDAAVDVATLGGIMNDGECQIAKRCSQIGKALDDAVEG